MHGIQPRRNATRRTAAALERVSMTAAANRHVAAYSKGMRQRIKLAQAIAHDPQVLVLDEPLNGLDPMARAETIALFREWGEQGRHVIVSSHILHEVDRISDQVILLSQGYVVAEGEIQGVRSEVKEQPMQILVRCDRPGGLAARLFQQDHMVEAKISARPQPAAAHHRRRQLLPAAEPRDSRIPAWRWNPWRPPMTT